MHSSVAALWEADGRGKEWRNPKWGLKAGAWKGDHRALRSMVCPWLGTVPGKYRLAAEVAVTWRADMDLQLELLSPCAEGLK